MLSIGFMATDTLAGFYMRTCSPYPCQPSPLYIFQKKTEKRKSSITLEEAGNQKETE